jgi:AcrR family transcriptional regulator
MEVDKEQLIRELLQRSLDHERMLVEDERRDRLYAKRQKTWDVLLAIGLTCCFFTSITAIWVTYNVSTGRYQHDVPVHGTVTP